MIVGHDIIAQLYPHDLRGDGSNSVDHAAGGARARQLPGMNDPMRINFGSLMVWASFCAKATVMYVEVATNAVDAAMHSTHV